MIFDNARFPFVAVRVDDAHWVVMMNHGKVLGRFVIL